jgi:alanine-glyoxylate transaminase/serine-glyoxylate transaminase/serine-pyruvate transaminase
MLPPGLVSMRCRRAPSSVKSQLPKSMGLGRNPGMNKTGYFPYTPNTNLLYGLHEALRCWKVKAWMRCCPPQKMVGGVRGEVELGLPVQCATKICTLRFYGSSCRRA